MRACECDSLGQRIFCRHFDVGANRKHVAYATSYQWLITDILSCIISKYRRILFEFWTKTVTAFLSHPPPMEGLWATYYTVHLRLIGKRVVDFILVLFNFFRSVLRLRRYEWKSEISIFDGVGLSVSVNFQIKGDKPHQPYILYAFVVISSAVCQMS